MLYFHFSVEMKISQYEKYTLRIDPKPDVSSVLCSARVTDGLFRAWEIPVLASLRTR